MSCVVEEFSGNESVNFQNNGGMTTVNPKKNGEGESKNNFDEPHGKQCLNIVFDEDKALSI